MAVIVDRRYAITKALRARSEMREVRAMFVSAHGSERGIRLLAMLTGLEGGPVRDRARDPRRPTGKPR